ncbi:FkbM family methyltransferase [Oscillatoria sp. FACHB-1406]|uniref:FkbM family methyltransferase n=1 Tax=Oscillatoria sp. FACHB-1406 TaxID=2692846 RepID=UPI0016897A2A|nr:FkbM family methyltransferase [Oscillatoria sp. FACHB-1406]MBD2578958.1 FkbM family methyltransferase [Oscillatoria sp. FACHB-1406]
MTLSNLKQSLLNRIVEWVRANLFLERLLCDFCANSFLRDRLKFGAIAYHYLSSFEHPEWRVTRLDGCQFWVNIAEYQGLWLYFFREHQEPRSARLAAELIRAGDTCIDVGANMGSYTFLMASRVGDRGRVFAFEPQPNLYQKLLDSQQLNSLEKILSIDSRILYSKTGEKCKLFLSEDARNSGMASTLCHGDFLKEYSFIERETVTLSDYFQAQKLKSCDLLKVDVECAEMEVFQGAIDLFQQHRIRYLIVEQAAGSDSQKLLQTWGYTGWYIDEYKTKLVALDETPKERFGNYLFVSPRELVEFKHRYSHWL